MRLGATPEASTDELVVVVWKVYGSGSRVMWQLLPTRQQRQRLRLRVLQTSTAEPSGTSTFLQL